MTGPDPSCMDAEVRAAQPDTPVALVSAVALVDIDGRILLAQRPEDKSMTGLWEFPGGKVEPGERPEKALHRELKKELGEKVRIISNGKAIRHKYTRFKVLLYPFICSAQKRFSPGSRKGEFRWILQKELKNYPFPTANRKIIQSLRFP